MAGEERDARLILQAEDRATKTFTAVAAAIKDVRKQLDEQAAAARRGDGDLTAINASLEKLRDLGKALVQDQALLNTFEKMGERVQGATERLEKAKVTLQAYEAELGQAGAVTDAQAAKLLKLQAGVTTAQGAYDKLSRSFGQVADRMQAAGLVAGQFDAQTDAIVASAKEAAAGISQATSAINAFGDAQAQAAAQRKVMAEADTLKQAVAASPLGPDDISYVLGFSNALERLREMEALHNREVLAGVAAEQQRRAALNAGVQDALGGNAQLLASFDQLNAQIKADAAGATFKKVGTDAAAAAADVSRFGVQGKASIDLLGDAVRAIASPLGAAVSTLDGVKAELTAVEAVAAKAGGGGINAMSEALGKLAAIQRSLVGQADLIDQFRAQEAAANGASAAFEAERVKVAQLAAQIAAADGPNEELANETIRAQKAMDAAGTAAQREKEKLAALSIALTKAGIDAKFLDAATEEIISSSNRAGAAAQNLGGKMKGKGGFLGLNPYELQNLSYQVNDVFTQLGSGTPILQIIAQQGGQILQLFRGAIPFLLQWAPLILAIAAPLLVVAAAVMKAHQAAEALKDFTQIFRVMGDGAEYSAQKFANASVALQDLGVKADAARDILGQFARDGLNQDGLEGFISTAKNMKEVLGTDVPDAFKALSAAATGGYDEIVKLNDITGALTDTELANIRTMFEQGDAEGARREAIQLTQDRIAQGVQQMNGPWADALRGAEVAWDSLLKALAGFGSWLQAKVKPAFDWLGQQLREAALGFLWLASIMDGKSGQEAFDIANRAMAPRAQGNAGGAVPGGPTAGGAEFLSQQEEQLKNARILTREGRLQAAAERARRDAAKAGANNAQVELAARNAIAIEQGKINREDAAAGRRSASAARAAENRAKALANRLASQQQAIENTIASMDAKVARFQNQSLDQRLSAVDAEYERVFDQIAKFEKEGGSKARANELRAQVNANVVILKQMEEMKYREEQINDLVAERTNKLKGVQDAYDRGEITAAEAIRRAQAINTELAPGIRKAAEDALIFARAIAGANPTPEMKAWIASLERTISDNSAGNLGRQLRELTDSTIATQGSRINAVLSQRNDLVDAENTLVKLGIRTRAEADRNIMAGFAATQPLLEQQTQEMRDLLATLDLTVPAQKLLYDTWTARLAALGEQSKYVSTTFTELKQGIDQAITQNALQGFDDMAKALGALITGGQGVGDTFLDIGRAALNFVGQTIGAIGRLILQMLILDAIQKATGIPVAALAGTMNGTGGGFNPASFFGSIFGGIFHGGGLGSRPQRKRRMPASAWANAPRYHEGYTPGLKRGEVTAILKSTEEVLNEDDPRHARNGGLGGGAGGAGAMPPIRNVLAIGDDQIAAAMAGPAGEQVYLTHVRRNRDATRAELGINN